MDIKTLWAQYRRYSQESPVSKGDVILYEGKNVKVLGEGSSGGVEILRLDGSKEVVLDLTFAE